MELLADLHALLTTIKSLGEALHAANPKRLTLKECLFALALDSESDADAESERSPARPPMPLSLHAAGFIQVVEDISIALVRFHWDKSHFDSPVIGYVALHTLNAYGAWIPARSFSFRLSGWIYCM